MAKRSSTAAAPRGTLSAATRILVLSGSEDLLKREHVATLRRALEEEHGDVLLAVFDGEFAALADVLDELRTYSLLQPHKLVIVEQADLFTQRYREPLERYAAAPVDHATLVLRAGGWRPGKLDKLIEKVGCLIKCEPPRRPEAAEWLLRRAKSHHHCLLAPPAAAALVERIGCDLGLLDSELAKLAAMAGDGRTIDANFVQQNSVRSSDEKAWAIQEALLAGLDPAQKRSSRERCQELLRKVHDLVELAGHDEVPVIWSVIEVMRKLCVALALRRQGASDREVAGQLKLWGPAETAFLNLLRHLDQPRVMAWFDQIITLDRRHKSGLGEPLRNLECFCALLTDGMEKKADGPGAARPRGPA